MKVYLLNPPYFPHFGRSAKWQERQQAVRAVIKYFY
jgi:anaerobic magnesium-protoporphyrin IX monomethyl ester cyclase